MKILINRFESKIQREKKQFAIFSYNDKLSKNKVFDFGFNAGLIMLSFWLAIGNCFTNTSLEIVRIIARISHLLNGSLRIVV